MKILTITPMGIYPPKTGGHLRVHYFLNELSKRGYKVFLFAQGLRSFEFKLKFLSPWFTKINANYFEYRYVNFLSLVFSYFCSMFKIPPIFSGNILSILNPKELLEEIKTTDLIIVEHPWQFKYIFSLKSKYNKRASIILDEPNVESKLISETILKIPLLSHLLYKVAYNKENYALKNADIIFATSGVDKKELIERFNIQQDKIFVIPNGVDISNFHSIFSKKKDSTPDINTKKYILFSGSIHPPNREAVKEILKISKEFMDQKVHFLIVGRCGKNFSNTKNITFTDYVENVASYFEKADIAINPMSFGSGTNIKMLEYLAAGLPTITTPIGARGLDLENGEHVIITNLKNFPQAIKELLNNPELQHKLRIAGRKLVEERYDWKKIVSKTEEIIRKLF